MKSSSLALPCHSGHCGGYVSTAGAMGWWSRPGPWSQVVATPECGCPASSCGRYVFSGRSSWPPRKPGPVTTH